MFTENSLYTLEFNMRPGLPEFDVLTIHLQNNIFDLFYYITNNTIKCLDLDNNSPFFISIFSSGNKVNQDWFRISRFLILADNNIQHKKNDYVSIFNDFNNSNFDDNTIKNIIDLLQQSISYFNNIQIPTFKHMKYSGKHTNKNFKFEITEVMLLIAFKYKCLVNNVDLDINNVFKNIIKHSIEKTFSSSSTEKALDIYIKNSLNNDVSQHELISKLNSAFNEKLNYEKGIFKFLIMIILIIEGIDNCIDNIVFCDLIPDRKISEHIQGNRKELFQKNIVNLYKGDFSQYEYNDRKLKIIEIYDSIPSQLNKQNLKFVFTYLNKELKFDRYENSFLWLKDAGVAYPIFNVSEIRPPLLISKEKNSFKLFSSDVGLLNSYYSLTIKQAIFEKNTANLMNLGGLFESFVASELKANGFEPFYYRSKNIGEIDFLIEKNNKIIPLEVKSGGDYKKHTSLNKLLISTYSTNLTTPYVLSTNNLEVKNEITYLPIYMLGFLKKDDEYNYIAKLEI